MNNKLLSLLAMTILIVGLILMKNSINQKQLRTATFATPQIPFSSDPLDYDYYTHHYAFSSIFAKLISIEKNGEIVPMIASHWSNANEFKIWKFKINKNLKFSNGDVITLDDVVINLKRIAYLNKKNNSHSGLFEFLVKFDKIQNLNEEMAGIKTVGDELVLEFVKPMPTLLEIISFGFYGIAHPTQFNHLSGEWNDKKSAIASGPYKISLWNEDEYEITYRDDVKYFNNVNPLRKIKFFLLTKIKKSSDLDRIDILVADKSSLLVDERFIYSGSAVNMKIGYVLCNSWDKPDRPFFDIKIRKWFREKFYENMKINGFTITNSFFPLNLQGIKKFESKEDLDNPIFNKLELVTHPISISGKIEENNNKKSIAEIFSEALKSLGDDSRVALIQKKLPTDDEYDLSINGTGIESASYLETVRFMFLSKEGIRLPDSNGTILKELSKENPDINFINQELWNQAVIWPLRHYSSGYWFNKNSNIDYSEINFDSASIDFQFLKWK